MARSFARLFDLVRSARNDALHQGAYARHLSTNAAQLALILEDALMETQEHVRDFMVERPVCATLWQPLQLIRQTMLANSFSYLPVFDDRDPELKTWRLISTPQLASYLRGSNCPTCRNLRLRQNLRDALQNGPPVDHTCQESAGGVSLMQLTLEYAKLMRPADPISLLFNEEDNGRPVLVLDPTAAPDLGGRLVGILMPFDVL